MHIGRKALYNLLRMNSLRDPSLQAESWQLEDYRSIPQEKLWERLHSFGVQLDQVSFIAYADDCETPEDLTDLILEQDLSVEEQDQIYLLIFELWRRLVPENLSLTIFCDELDYNINLYDQGMLEGDEHIQDALDCLASMLEGSTDEGTDPIEAFDSVCTACAHDVENFLFDYIGEQIEADNHSYASDLVETFYDYVKDVKWFDLLRARILQDTDWEAAHNLLCQLVEEAPDEPDLELGLELLSLASNVGDLLTVRSLLEYLFPLLKVEEDFQETLELCGDFFRFHDADKQASCIEKLLSTRQTINPDTPLSNIDAEEKQLLALFSSKVISS